MGAAHTGPVPNVIIAGVSKCGTTSLFRYLASHPDVCASAVKEVNFFTHAGRDSLDLSLYAPQFERCAGRSPAVYLEASPIYLHYAETVAPAMRTALPDVRIVFILRNPIDRFVSHFRYLQLKAGLIPRDLTPDAFVDRISSAGSVVDDRVRAEPADCLQCLHLGLYAANLRRYLDTFDPQRVFVGFLEHLEQAPREFMGRLCAFLRIGAEPYGTNYRFAVENRRRNPTYPTLNRVAEVLTLRYERFFNRHPAVRARLRQIYHRVNPERVSIDADGLSPAARGTLTRYYAPSVADLDDLLSRYYPSVERPAWVAAWPAPR